MSAKRKCRGSHDAKVADTITVQRDCGAHEVALAFAVFPCGCVEAVWHARRPLTSEDFEDVTEDMRLEQTSPEHLEFAQHAATIAKMAGGFRLAMLHIERREAGGLQS